MSIIGNYKFCTGSNSTIYKLIIIRIFFNQSKMNIRCLEAGIR